ncbi:MAG TPA: glycosyltransferase family 2 protein [Usitatibacter sp.]|jgi:rhamnosyltransferase|nr:glycosyltransferase family 2 protein [Usitatibacter sp.]
MPFATDSYRIASVTVALDPDRERLLAQLRALEGQADDRIVVDNGSRQGLDAMLRSAGVDAHILRLERNQGVAAGFNLGVEAAIGRGATHVLLLDHDSIPAPNMLAVLRGVMADKESLQQNVAAVGPCTSDGRDARELPFIRLGWLRNHHVRPRGTSDVVSCDFLITSGALVPVRAYRELGAFDESFFVDNVDLEWCFRARSRGFLLYGAAGARLDHRLGDRRVRIGNRQLVVHSPERLYYMTRNRLLLYQRPYAPLKWKLKDALRGAAKFAATMMFVAPRAEYARMTWRGLSDALQRRAGRLRG